MHSVYLINILLTIFVKRYVKVIVKFHKVVNGETLQYLYQESEPENTSRFGQLIQSNPYITYQIYDPYIKKLLIDYSHRTIIVGQTVIDYVKNNFQAPLLQASRLWYGYINTRQSLAVARIYIEK